MLEKIVSGGQTGVDRAALDTALGIGFPCGGWCPRGRRAEDGPIDPRYPLQETPSSRYVQRTRWNVRDSDGTLVLTVGPPTGGTKQTIELAFQLGKPCLVLDLSTTPAVETVACWLREYQVLTLNVAGPRESTRPGAYQLALAFLSALFATPASPS